MTVTVSSMFIPVHDPDAALGFYRDALGLEVRLDVASDGFRWVTVGAPGQDVGIVLFQPHGGRSQAEGDALLALVTQGSLQAAIFASDDLDTTFEKVRASGAEVLQEPASQPWGARDSRVPRPLGQPRPDRPGLTAVRPGSVPPVWGAWAVRTVCRMTSGPTHEVQCPECLERFPLDAAVRIRLSSGRVLICPSCATRLQFDADSGQLTLRPRASVPES